MSTLTVFDFQSQGIRFENRDGRVWVNLTDMSKASGKLIGGWNRLESTKEFLTELETIMQICIIESKVGNIAESERGTWAIEEVAIEFAGWCSVQFKIWCLQQIKTLITEGTVSIKPKTALELAKEQVKLLEQLELQSHLIADLEQEVLEQAEIIDELFDYSSILRVAKFNNCSEKAFSWRALKAASKAMGLEIKVAPCPRFGTKNLYSHDVWRYVYPQYKLPETTTVMITTNQASMT